MGRMTMKGTLVYMKRCFSMNQLWNSILFYGIWFNFLNLTLLKLMHIFSTNSLNMIKMETKLWQKLDMKSSNVMLQTLIEQIMRENSGNNCKTQKTMNMNINIVFRALMIPTTVFLCMALVYGMTWTRIRILLKYI